MSLTHQLKPVPFTQVQLHDAFWAPRMLANRTVTLPAQYAQLEHTGRLAALELAWQPGAGSPPHIFWDSDIAKWIEAAAYALAAQVDAQLDAQLDAVIARLALAQQPDGYLNSHFIVTERAGLQRRWTNLRDSHELYCAAPGAPVRLGPGGCFGYSPAATGPAAALWQSCGYSLRGISTSTAP